MIIARLLQLFDNDLKLLAVAFALLVPVLAYISWRAWTFTIQPMLHPEQPRELPYSIPYIGEKKQALRSTTSLSDNAQLMALNTSQTDKSLWTELGTLPLIRILDDSSSCNTNQDFVHINRRYLGDTREPFAISVGSNKLYFLTSSVDISAMYKETTTLDFVAIVKALLLMYGVSREGFERSQAIPDSIENDEVNKSLQLHQEKPRSLASHTRDFEHAQLLPGPRHSALQESMVRSLQKLVTPSAFHPYYVVSPTSIDGRKHITVSLFNWTYMVLTTAVSDAIFGPRLARDNLALLEAFRTFGKHNWKIWYGWKNAEDAKEAKAKYVAEIDKYLQIPFNEREAEQSWMWSSIEKAYSAAGMSKADIVQRAGLTFWVSASNPARLAFWILNFLLFRPSLLSQVKEELEGALSTPNAAPDLQRLAESSPYLNAVIDEALRITVRHDTVRIVTKESGIKMSGGKVIPYKARLFAPMRQLHLDENVWDDATSFRPERWLSKELAPDSRKARDNYKPFGGGTTYCSGRVFAKNTVRAFLAIAFARFEIGLAPGQEELHVKFKEPGQGVAFPQGDSDLSVRLTSRS